MASDEVIVKKIHPFFCGPSKNFARVPDSSTELSTTDGSHATTPKNDRDEDTTLNDQLNEPLAKRRRTESLDGFDSGEEIREHDHSLLNNHANDRNIDFTLFSSRPKNIRNESTESRKMLRIDPETGKFGGLPSSSLDQKNETQFTVGRSRKSPKSLLIKVLYGKDDSSRARIGSLINRILDEGGNEKQRLGNSVGKERARAQQKGEPFKNKQRKPINSKDIKCEISFGSFSSLIAPQKQPLMSQAPQSTLTFFLGKTKDNPATNSPETQSLQIPTQSKSLKLAPKEFSSTPRSPKKPRPPPPSKLPQFGARCSGTKVPGVREPAWPWKGIVHIRDDQLLLENLSTCRLFTDGIAPHTLKLSRKSKSAVRNIFNTESILTHFERSISVQAVAESMQRLAGDDFAPIPPQLRLPVRRFESGHEIQKRVKPRIQTLEQQLTASNDGELCTNDANARVRMHNAISRLFYQLATELPAFDRSTCENSTWAQKYAPMRAVEVLQAGKEALLLKEWLEHLEIHTVDTGNMDISKIQKKGRLSKDTAFDKKKKRKRNKLDGFIVESEDEEDEMDELLDTDNDWMNIAQGQPKTVIRIGDQVAKGKDNVKLKNAVVISGPHGSGKTAAVYAVAKELGYEVREIHAGSRRSGKDVAEMIEAMTQNHIVRHSLPGQRATDEGEQTEDEVTKDIKSERKKTMANFFKPKPATKTTKIAKSSMPTKQSDKSDPKKATAHQKQSLILLEEVDILYDQDRQFWPTVMGLITQSKRPFIITCNDERLVPLHNLNLHGIFRFTPPPLVPAVDHILLIAANEGHILERDAVESLYKSRNYDIRASLSELNFWCQMGVGDQRSGLSWYYPRWPKGTDVDQNGNVVRVISENTYHEGMGWLSRDSINGPNSSILAETNLMIQIWEEYGFDIGQWQDTLDMEAWAEEVGNTDTTRTLQLEMLYDYEAFSLAMSDADIFSQRSFAQDNRILFDTSLPNLTPVLRDDYAIGQALLEVMPVHYHDQLSMAMATWAKSLARARLAYRSQPWTLAHESPISAIDESNAVAHIRTQHMPKVWDPAISRTDMARAFDAIAASEKQLNLQTGSLDPSVFDRTMNMITLEVAPYVRRIVSYDMRLQEERMRLSSLLSAGGRAGKRMRTTRSAFSALEGSSRRTTRRDKYFGNLLNSHLVMKTAGLEWNQFVDSALAVAQEKEKGPAVKSFMDVESDLDTGGINLID